MRIVLLHNSSAGSEDRTDDELRSLLREAGHEVLANIAQPKQLPDLLARSAPELVVVAGGDGTVGRAASIVAGTPLPLAILPVGTANNFARTLGIDVDGGEVATWIDAWSSSQLRGIDLALASRGREQRTFLEALGFGLFPEVMRRSEREPAPPEPAQALARHLTLFRHVVEHARPTRYTLRIDERDHTGEYLLAEVMNIPLLGPNVPLTATSEPDDGVLELCLVHEDQRASLLALIDDLRAGRATDVCLPLQPVRRLSIASGEACHLDGEHWPCEGERVERVEVTLRAGAVCVLAPVRS